jgi:YbbR domain-containing protein
MKKTQMAAGISLKNNRKLKVFLMFLILTSIIWLLVELSKTFTSNVVFNVTYENVPANKLLQNTPVSEVSLTVKAPGFSLLRLTTKKPKITFSLKSVRAKNNGYYFLPNAQLSYLNEQFSKIEILNVLQDTIFVDLGKNVTKKVPVNANLDIKFKLGYNFTEPVKITPDSILITGSELEVAEISEIPTVLLKLNEVYETIDKELSIELPAKSNKIKLSETNVKLTGKVDKFTEGRFTIPVSIINQPQNVIINPFPKEIELVYQVAISNFNSITKDSFSVVFDYNDYKKDTLVHYLSPVVQQKSALVHSLKINPTKIEFLIQKSQ